MEASLANIGTIQKLITCKDNSFSKIYLCIINFGLCSIMDNVIADYVEKEIKFNIFSGIMLVSF